jgi:threonine synthase
MPVCEFSDAVLTGLAPDGGLVFPEKISPINLDTLNKWRGLSYQELALEIISIYVTDIDHEALKEIIDHAYTTEKFGSEEITPLTRLHDDLYILGLSNGPTLAFKDVAMQFLGELFSHILQKRDQVMNIVGATSGDTGSAAEYAMQAKPNINVFMLSPQGRMSDFQRAQMYSLDIDNINNIAVEGTFDDCQDMVKAINQDAEFKAGYSLGAVNSINWARILAQVVYYFKAYFSVTTENTEKVSFSVPSGNFGNIFAGFVAKRMGLPVHQLILATNENNVLDEFFKTGVYRVRSSEETHATSSPSMDISKASNFERFVYLLLDEDGEKVSALWEQLARTGSFDLSEHPRMLDRSWHGIYSGTSTHEDRMRTIKQIYETYNVMLDPHTADGVKVAAEVADDGYKLICLETALPAKFGEIIEETLSLSPDRPESMKDIESLPQFVDEMPKDVAQLKEYIQQKLISATE